jgi:hypothetical protein
MKTENCYTFFKKNFFVAKTQHFSFIRKPFLIFFSKRPSPFALAVMAGCRLRLPRRQTGDTKAIAQVLKQR